MSAADPDMALVYSTDVFQVSCLACLDRVAAANVEFCLFCPEDSRYLERFQAYWNNVKNGER